MKKYLFFFLLGSSCLAHAMNNPSAYKYLEEGMVLARGHGFVCLSQYSGCKQNFVYHDEHGFDAKKRIYVSRAPIIKNFKSLEELQQKLEMIVADGVEDKKQN